MEMPDLTQIWPEWKIEKQIGRGTFGTVWQAVRHCGDLTGYAAIKRISIPQDPYELEALRSDGLDLQASRTYLKRIVEDFSNECRMMESFKGIPNIVSIEDYKIIEHTDVLGWDIYIRMELLTPLSTYLCDRKITEEDSIRLGCDICTALELCARRNIIHRDIKPDNIFVNSLGSFKLGDFGTARQMESLTGGLSQKGTFNYMAPEVISGGEYDARVDVYSLGLVLYRLLNNNRLPFVSEKQLLSPGERRNAFDRRMRGEPLPAPCSASPEMAQVILKACAYRPEDRYESAAQMKNALQALSSNAEQIPAPVPAAQTLPPEMAPTEQPPAKKGRKSKEKNSAVSLNAPEMYIDAPDFSDPQKKSPLARVLTVLLVLLLLIGFCTAAYLLGSGYLHNAMCDGVLLDPVSETTVPPDEPEQTEPVNETTVPSNVVVLPAVTFENLDVQSSACATPDGDGYNNAGDWVYWCMEIGFDLPAETIDAFPPTITASWGHVYNGGRISELAGSYQDAKAGKTYVERGTWLPENSPTGQSRYSFFLRLPDDPTIAGEQSLTVRVGSCEKTICFTLEYMGDYETGTGWAISNINYDDMPTQSDSIIETTVPDDFSDAEDSISFDNMTVECSIHCNQEKTMGYNSYDDLVFWCIYIDFDMAVAQSYLLDYSISCSWDEVVNGNGTMEQKVGFSDAKQGMTYAEYATLPASINPHFDKDRFSFMLMLPDDPSIAGEQTITVQVGESRKEIHLTLEHLGNYETGTGWAIGGVYYGDDPDGGNKLLISDIFSSCMYLEEPRIGYNSQGEYVDWIISFDYYLKDDTLSSTTPVISSSWDNTIEQNIYWDFRHVYNSSNGAETQFVYFPYEDRVPYLYNVTLFLPDDPSIAGDQIIGIQVGDYLSHIYLTLEYLGDYETGTGWAISDVSYDESPAASDSSSPDENVSDPGSESLQICDFEHLSIGLGGLSYDNEENSGNNQYGDLVNWCLWMEFDMTVLQRVSTNQNISCSWGEVANGDLKEPEVGSFQSAKNGMTYASYTYTSKDMLPYAPETFTFLLMLPDDPSIAGEQTVTIQVGESVKDIHLTLQYLGDYETGTGWAISDVYYAGMPTASDPVVLENADALDVTNLHCNGMYDMDAGIGVNSQGEYVNWVVFFDYSPESGTLDDSIPAITTSWGNVTNKNSLWNFSEVYNAAKAGGTQFTYGFSGDDYTYYNCVQLMLPDDPSIAGEQTITIQVGESVKDIHLTLEYLGDYETGTGWAISDVYYD